MIRRARSGFTLIELLVVVTIIIVIGGIVVADLSGRRLDTDLVATTQEVATLLRQAESNAATDKSSATWGVYFSNVTSTAPFYALFSGSYTTGTVAGQYRLPSTVAYQTSTLASGATTSITFAAISGAPSTSTSIGLYMPNENAAFSSTITVSQTGEVSY